MNMERRTSDNSGPAHGTTLIPITTQTIIHWCLCPRFSLPSHQLSYQSTPAAGPLAVFCCFCFLLSYLNISLYHVRLRLDPNGLAVRLDDIQVATVLSRYLLRAHTCTCVNWDFNEWVDINVSIVLFYSFPFGSVLITARRPSTCRRGYLIYRGVMSSHKQHVAWAQLLEATDRTLLDHRASTSLPFLSRNTHTTL